MLPRVRTIGFEARRSEVHCGRRLPGREGQQRSGGVDSEPERPAGTQDLVPLVYQELREVARRYFRGQRPDFTLHPTELVNEACLHLLQHAPGPWDSPEHFRAIATRKIWQIVIDHIKRRHAAKRGGGYRRARESDPEDTSDAGLAADAAGSARDDAWRRIPLERICVEWRDRPVELLDLADALDELAACHQRLRDVVMLHWFGGLTHAEVSRLLGVSLSTVEKDYRYALAWLQRRLQGAGHDGD
jgi:RNA polymerase sigma-70 factor (ECF subfamily)